jgi:hypothetical protein
VAPSWTKHGGLGEHSLEKIPGRGDRWQQKKSEGKTQDEPMASAHGPVELKRKIANTEQKSSDLANNEDKNPSQLNSNQRTDFSLK